MPASWKTSWPQDSWLTVPAKASILFELPPEERLPAAMQKLGVELHPAFRRGRATADAVGTVLAFDFGAKRIGVANGRNPARQRRIR